ncbi:MAG: hypothetical protein KDD27_09720 [Saprospiraceae bacterium]|nr:hypothetical protein [Saprospiraceae bacterium]
MAKRTLRVTGFTRFFLVMIIVAPLAYIGASYYNGDNGVEKIKSFLNMQAEDETAESEQPGNDNVKPVNQSPANAQKIISLETENKRLQEELDFKTKRVDELYRENEELKRKLESMEKTLNETKDQ